MPGPAASLPLQTKVSLTLVAVIVGFAVFTYVVMRVVILPAFDDLEANAAIADLVRVEQSLQSDLDNLGNITADWARWDDIYQFVKGSNPGFQRSNLGQSTLDNLDLDFMAVFSMASELRWGRVHADHGDVAMQFLGIAATDSELLTLITSRPSADSALHGWVSTTLGPALISVRPIVKTDSSGPPAGVIVMGQLMDQDRLLRTRERTEVQVSWRAVSEPAATLSGAEQAVLERGGIESVAGSATISTFRLYRDVAGAPLLIIHTETPRSISLLGGQTIRATLLLLAIGGVIVTVVTWYVLRGTILRPIEGLEAHIDQIRRSGDLSQRYEPKGNDEVASLARQFDSLTAEVHDARRALLEQSFKAGKADTAAEVLHNVRNAMTPVVNGLDRLSRNYRSGTDLRVAEAVEQLADTECPAERREKLLQYLDASFKFLRAAGEEAEDDLGIVKSQARQVENILSHQEKFASAEQVSEELPVAEVVTEAAHVLPRHATPEVDLELDSGLATYRVRAHRIGLLQVLSNLILNAFESIQRGGDQPGEIRLSADEALLGDRNMVRLTVHDNGQGFDAAVSECLFQRGFTSKQHGDTAGLGLHWCANAVAGMGGRIFAESRGPGQGAEFHVLLPAAEGAQP